MKIGILTYHGSYNYGAFLQAYALCSRLNQESDITAEIIDYNMPSAMQGYLLKKWSLPVKLRHFRTYRFRMSLNRAFERGREKIKSCMSENALYSDSITEFQEFVSGRYDAIVAGSDEIWKLDGERGFPTPYWLPGNLRCRKLAYAASSRSDWTTLEDEGKVQLKKLLADFSYITVRDDLTYRLVVENGVQASRVRKVCDPSFLCRIQETEDIRTVLRHRAGIIPDKPVIVMMCDSDAVVQTILGSIGRAKENYTILSVYRQHRGCINISDLDPFEWHSLIAGADLVISSFFHGVCFSIVNNTPFLAVGTKKKHSKLEELLLGTELETSYYKEESCGNEAWQERIKEKLNSTPEYGQFVRMQQEGVSDFLAALRQRDFRRIL